MSFKEKEIVLIPTDKVENCLILYKAFQAYKSQLKYEPINFFTQSYLKNSNRESYHLYIVSGEKPVENEWCLEYNSLGTKVMEICKAPSIIPGECILRKIIATTNSELKLPQLSKDFIEKYCIRYNESNKIEKVLIEYNELYQKSNIFSEPSIKVGEKLFVNPEYNVINVKICKDVYTREEVEQIVRLIHFKLGSNAKESDEYINKML